MNGPRRTAGGGLRPWPEEPAAREPVTVPESERIIEVDAAGLDGQARYGITRARLFARLEGGGFAAVDTRNGPTDKIEAFPDFRSVLAYFFGLPAPGDSETTIRAAEEFRAVREASRATEEERQRAADAARWRTLIGREEKEYVSRGVVMQREVLVWNEEAESLLEEWAALGIGWAEIAARFRIAPSQARGKYSRMKKKKGREK